MKRLFSMRTYSSSWQAGNILVKLDRVLPPIMEIIRFIPEFTAERYRALSWAR
jgi:hypothetical protein